MTTAISQPYRHQLSTDCYYELVLVRAGTFIMGSEAEEADNDEKPEHLVRLTQDYYIGAYPVTQAVWEAVMGEGSNPSGFKGPQRPVECISWLDIVEGNQEGDGAPAFLDRLNDRFPHPSGWRFRLPTEAEWEYAARAASPYLYAGSDKLKEVGWYNSNSHDETKEVGLKAPNPLGLYDMSGNVYEWCHDWASDSYYQECYDEGVVENPTGPEEGQGRVLRGGRWWRGPQYCRVAVRNGYPPTLRTVGYGFRLVLAPSSRAATPRGDAE